MKIQSIFGSILFLLVCVAGIHAQTSTKGISCEVLEVSDEYRGEAGARAGAKELSPIRYLIIRHKNAADRSRFSEWLHNESGSVVMFTISDGTRRRGVLRRLRMCFGRGLLIFAGAVTLKERDTIVVELK